MVSADSYVYRLYNPRNGEHLYTTDTNERDVLFFDRGWRYEGDGWVAPDQGTPVYRLYNRGLQNHLYTSVLNEVNILISRHGWRQEGIKFKGTAIGKQIRTQYFDSNADIIAGDLGNSEWIFLRSDDAAWVAEDALNDPSSEFHQYQDYEFVELITSNGTTFYSVDFFN
ncbi:Uncharacterised protein [Chlamydia trachomatis]|nr:Uncharacterised protein [Chlamydia trachomatis]